MNARYAPRPRVEATLRYAVASAQLTLLQAPLGSGKTAAATTAFEGRSDVVWMESEAWQHGAFVSAIVQTVRQARPDFGRMTLGAAEAGANSEQVGKIFAEELQHIDEPLTLIVDNADIFTSDSAFAGFIDAAVRGLPDSVHIVLLGRSLPEMHLGRGVVEGRIRALGQTLLTFDADEVRSLAHSLNQEIAQDRVDAILQRTEGWAAGVSLAVSAPEVQLPAGSPPRAWVEAYLNEQLIESLTPPTAHFLELTSVFETLDLSVLDGLFDDPLARIEELQRSGALISEVRAGRYRVHPLLRELAQQRLRAAGRWHHANSEASKAYARSGYIAAALFHADAAGDPQTAAQFLREYADSAAGVGDQTRLQALAMRIDLEGRDADARLYAEALLAKMRGAGDAREKFAKAEQSARESGDEDLVFKALAQIVEYDLGHRLRADRGALDELTSRSASLNGGAKASAAMLCGWSFAIDGDFRGALQCIVSLEPVEESQVQFNTGILRAYAQTALGDLEEAERTMDRLAHILELSDRVILQTQTLIWFARLALIWGHTITASDVASAAARLATALSLRADEAALYAALAETATHEGNAQTAATFSERARDRSEYAWYAADVARIRAFASIALARTAFLRNENAVAFDLAFRTGNAAEHPAVQRAVALAECSIYAVLAGRRDAQDVADAARTAIASAPPVDAADAVALAISDDLLHFLSAAGGRQYERALSGTHAFQGLLQRRDVPGFEHAGIALHNASQGNPGEETLDAVLSAIERDGPRFEARLLRAYAGTLRKPTAQTERIDLTERENEILELLVEGLANKEIAQRLLLSPRTVETHVERILGKLGVGSRSRAIAKALRLQIVSVPA